MSRETIDSSYGGKDGGLHQRQIWTVRLARTGVERTPILDPDHVPKEKIAEAVDDWGTAMHLKPLNVVGACAPDEVGPSLTDVPEKMLVFRVRSPLKIGPDMKIGHNQVFWVRCLVETDHGRHLVWEQTRQCKSSSLLEPLNKALFPTYLGDEVVSDPKGVPEAWVGGVCFVALVWWIVTRVG